MAGVTRRGFPQSFGQNLCPGCDWRHSISELADGGARCVRVHVKGLRSPRLENAAFVQGERQVTPGFFSGPKHFRTAWRSPTTTA